MLNSIKKQTYKNYEIIVCDSHSKDNTLKIAKSFGAKCYSIDKKGPGHGRNIGAKYAKGRYLLFFDSDTIIPDKFFLFKFFRQVNKKNLELANVFQFLHPFNIKDIPINIFVNIFFKIHSYFNPLGAGFFIFVKKNIFDNLGGFDESINIGEDYDFMRRASKISNYKMINQYVYYSNRRFELEGRINLCLKYIYYAFDEFLEPIIGKIELDYKFGHYDSKKESQKYEFLINKINVFFSENKDNISIIFKKHIEKINKKVKKKIKKIVKNSKKISTKFEK